MDSGQPDVWVKIDDGYPGHDKLLAAGAEGMALDVAGMCWSAKRGTDGFVPDYAITVLYPVKNPRGVASRLVQVGRWERDDVRQGWVIHDFLKYNPSAAQVAELREARSQSGQRGGQASAAARAQANASTSGRAPTEHDAQHNANPVSPEVKSNTMLPPGSELFEPFWRVYPKRNGRKVGKADAEKVWRRLKPADISACLVAVNHYAAACDSGQTLAMDAHRWLTKRRWQDWQEPVSANGTQYVSAQRVSYR